MIDETNVYVVEPSGSPRFRSKSLLKQHVRKHVFDRNEKWWKVMGFDSAVIHRARTGNLSALRSLCLGYQRFVGRTVVQYCKTNRCHRHLLSIRKKLPSALLQAHPEYEEDRKPYQIIKCWVIDENMIVVLSSPVRNDKFGSYVIKTGYRTWPNLKRNTWLKRELEREEEVRDLRNGRQLIPIVDHLGSF